MPPESNVWVRGHGWFGPSYPDNGELPDLDVASDEQTDTPSRTDRAPAEAKPTGQPTPPPRSGKGSSDENWTAYARAHNVEITDAMSRREVIAAVEAAGLPT